MAFLLPWTCVLLGCFSVSLAGASNFSDLYPPLWKKIASQFSDYGVKNGKYIIDPWVYPERMGMYKILVNKTASYFENILLDNEQNILWGLPLQNGWQYKTGRLADPRRRTDCGYDSDPLCVSVDSWWADMNYFLCALPFLAAVDSGIMGISSDQVMLLPPPRDQTKFCLNVSSCRLSFPEIMSKWNAFYQHLQYPSSTFEDLLKYLWAAHVATIDTVGKIFEDRYFRFISKDNSLGNATLSLGNMRDCRNFFSYRLEYYSKAEANFGRNWCVAVDYLAASLFPTTLVRTHEFQEGLPPRMLVNGDRAPFISDFTEFQNTVLLLLSFLSQVDNFPGSFSQTIWETLMKTHFVRKQVLELSQIILEIFNPAFRGVPI